MTETLAIKDLRPVDESARTRAEEHQLQLTKPAGSLGRLESLGNQLSAIAGTCPPPIPTKALVVIFAGDHGVQAAQRVSPWPQEVTQQMAVNIAGGGAGISVLARSVGAEVVVYNVGALVDLPETDNLKNLRIRPGTDDMTVGPAMMRAEAVQALQLGIDIARQAVADGYQVLIPGEVGIGNTTAAAALISVFTGADAVGSTGRGAGADDEMLARKRSAVSTAIEVNQASAVDPIGALAAVGGLEHAALAGLMLGGAASGIPVLIDGVIACSAALVAQALHPLAPEYFIAGHGGVEPGIVPALETLGLTPLLHLDFRLGEATGAVMALPLVQASARILAEMATFDSAGVTSEHD